MKMRMQANRLRVDPALLALLVVIASGIWLLQSSKALDVIAHTQTAPEPSSAGDQPPAPGATTATAMEASDPFWPQRPATMPAPVEAAPLPVIPLPAQAAVDAAPPAPPRPVLPFRYFGRMTNPEGKPIILIARDRDLYEALPGRVLDEFRVSEVEAARIGFEHVPSGEMFWMETPAGERGTR